MRSHRRGAAKPRPRPAATDLNGLKFSSLVGRGAALAVPRAPQDPCPQDPYPNHFRLRPRLYCVQAPRRNKAHGWNHHRDAAPRWLSRQLPCRGARSTGCVREDSRQREEASSKPMTATPSTLTTSTPAPSFRTGSASSVGRIQTQTDAQRTHTHAPRGHAARAAGRVRQRDAFNPAARARRAVASDTRSAGWRDCPARRQRGPFAGSAAAGRPTPSQPLGGFYGWRDRRAVSAADPNTIQVHGGYASRYTDGMIVARVLTAELDSAKSSILANSACHQTRQSGCVYLRARRKSRK